MAFNLKKLMSFARTSKSIKGVGEHATQQELNELAAAQREGLKGKVGGDSLPSSTVPPSDPGVGSETKEKVPASLAEDIDESEAAKQRRREERRGKPIPTEVRDVLRRSGKTFPTFFGEYMQGKTIAEIMGGSKPTQVSTDTAPTAPVAPSAPAPAPVAATETPPVAESTSNVISITTGTAFSVSGLPPVTPPTSIPTLAIQNAIGDIPALEELADIDFRALVVTATAQQNHPHNNDPEHMRIVLQRALADIGDGTSPADIAARASVEAQLAVLEDLAKRPSNQSAPDINLLPGDDVDMDLAQADAMAADATASDPEQTIPPVVPAPVPPASVSEIDLDLGQESTDQPPAVPAPAGNQEEFVPLNVKPVNSVAIDDLPILDIDELPRVDPDAIGAQTTHRNPEDTFIRRAKVNMGNQLDTEGISSEAIASRTPGMDAIRRGLSNAYDKIQAERERSAKARQQAIFDATPTWKKKLTSIGAAFNRAASTVKQGLVAIPTNLVNGAKTAKQTVQTAVTGQGQERTDARRAIGSYTLDAATGWGITTLTRAGIGATLAATVGATAAPVALMAGTALATGVVTTTGRIGYNVWKDREQAKQIGWAALAKQKAKEHGWKRGVLGGVFGAVAGLGLTEAFDWAHHAFGPKEAVLLFPPETTAEQPAPAASAPAPIAPTPEPVPSVPEATAPATPVAPEVATAPAAQAPAEVAAAPTAAVDTAAQEAQEKAARRAAWIERQNHLTDQLNTETRADIAEKVQQFPNTTLQPDPSTEASTTPRPAANGNLSAELRNCQAVGRTADGGFNLECDKNSELFVGMVGKMKLAMGM